MTDQYCFCTLAIGERYRTHAKMLAEDMQKYAPDTAFVILTDRPQEFEHLSHVLAFPHRLQSVRGLHDKRWVLEKALTRFNACIFIDADIRILGPVPETLPFEPGIVARYGCGIIKHNGANKIRTSFGPIQSTAKTLNLDLEEVVWFHEFMFLFSKQQGKEETFFRYWKEIAREFEIKGIYHGVGNVMGLAAAASGFDISFHRSDLFLAFKDNIQKEKIKAGKAEPDAMQKEFAVHRAIEYPKRSLTRKVTDKIQSKTGFYSRLAKLHLSDALQTNRSR